MRIHKMISEEDALPSTQLQTYKHHDLASVVFFFSGLKVSLGLPSEKITRFTRGFRDDSMGGQLLTQDVVMSDFQDLEGHIVKAQWIEVQKDSEPQRFVDLW